MQRTDEQTEGNVEAGGGREAGQRRRAFARPRLADPGGQGRRAAYLIAIAVLAAIVFLPGLDTFGAYAWQEGQRLLVARQMQERLQVASGWRETADALLVPRTHGVAYLAKPPMIYWAQMLAARISGASVELVHLRLVVALAGMFGVIATFRAARELLRPAADERGLNGVQLTPAWADHGAAWSAAFLATGVLFVRSGRIGELDVLLALFCVLAITGVTRAWRMRRETGRIAWGSLAWAALWTACAALTKDPAVLIIALAAYGGVILHAAFGVSGRQLSMPARWVVLIAGACGAGFAARTADSLGDMPGAAIIGSMCALLAAIVLKFGNPVARRAAWAGLKATAPWLVLGAGVVASVAWRLSVSGLIGDTEARALLSQEVDDNIRIFIAEAPLNNLKACLFGVGIGSLFAVFGGIWMVKERQRLSPGMAILVAWIVFTLIAFSVLGKGVQRYLTPTWPAIAILGGMTMATLLAARRPAVRLPWMVGAVVVLLALGQSWHYGFGRQLFSPEYSAREFVSELRAMPDVDMDRLVTYKLSNPSVSFYAGQRVESVGNNGVNSSMSGGGEISVDALKMQVGKDGSALAIVRTRGKPNEESDPRSELGELRAAGFDVQPVPLKSKFKEPSGVELRCYRLTLATEPRQ